MSVTLLIIGLVLVAVAAALFWAAARKSRQEGGTTKTAKPREDPMKFADGAANFGPEVLGPGAIISYGGIDYVCRGRIEFRQGSYTWNEYLLEGGSGGQYLSVEYDEGELKLGWWITRPDLEAEPAAEMTVEGVRYRKVESGVGEYSSEGTTGVADYGRFRFWDMAEAGGNRLLGFEQYDEGPQEISLGRTVLPGELTAYPAPEA